MLFPPVGAGRKMGRMYKTQSFVQGVYSLKIQVLFGWWDSQRSHFVPSFTNPSCPSALKIKGKTPGMYNLYLPDSQKSTV